MSILDFPPLFAVESWAIAVLYLLVQNAWVAFQCRLFIADT
jgi:hypothetical protein